MFESHETMEELADSKEEAIGEVFSHLVSEWLQELGYTPRFDADVALKRTFDACCALNISIELNFRKVYTYDGKSLRPDWQLSDLGCYLFLVNCDPSNPRVAKAQLYFASKAHQPLQ